MAPPSKYTPEFREEAVQIALWSRKAVSEVGRELGINPETLRGWAKKHNKQNEPPADAGLPLNERAPLERAGRNHELEMKNTFLKKCAASFAKDPQQQASTSSSRLCSSTLRSTRFPSGPCANGLAFPGPATTTGAAIRIPRRPSGARN
ncbi:transposase [Streptomyces noursei]|uniref:transposase n=1 Tax=Streptomyces noursei TaxID=1971 RepID=UPI000C9AE746